MRMCGDAGCAIYIIGYSVKLDVYRIWNYTICSRNAAEVFPLLSDRPKTRCVKCTPMCASARVAPSNIVYL